MIDQPPASVFPLADARGSFRALAGTFVPELTAAGPDRWEALERTITETLAARPPALGRQLRLLVRLLDILALLRYGQTLPRLAPARRSALLHAVERAPVLLLRRGIWGLRTLVLMGWYTQEPVMRALGYAASPAGWEAGP